ncbi:MAG: HIT family protein [Actinomycetota bacterium]|nr:HIT family protein [Actinomycetota bacterium]
MTNCTFCRIIAGDAAADVVDETEHTVAFLDHVPLFAGHTLVVPRRHIVTLDEVDADLLASIMGVVQRLVAAMPAALGCQGTFVANNNIVSQSVPHLHVHVVPRTKGDGLRGFFWPRSKYAPGERETTASRLRDALASQ